MKKKQLIIDYLNSSCISMIKCTAIQRLRVRFRLTQEEALKVYGEWRKEYLRGE